jgi:hypothetical protein
LLAEAMQRIGRVTDQTLEPIEPMERDNLRVILQRMA